MLVLVHGAVILTPANYKGRSDFNADGDVDVGDVMMGFAKTILTMCNP